MWRSVPHCCVCHHGPVTASLRDRKRERTRQALVAAGLHLFAERGFEAVTVAEIAEHADVAPRTFHRYFPDKVELLFAEDAAFRTTVLDALRQAPPEAGPGRQVRGALEAVGAQLAHRRDEVAARDRLLAQVPALRARELAKRAELERLVAAHLAARLGVAVDEDVRPRWWAGVALATFTAAYEVWLARGGDLGEHLRAAGELLPPD